MSPPHLRYSITDCRLLPPHQPGREYLLHHAGPSPHPEEPAAGSTASADAPVFPPRATAPGHQPSSRPESQRSGDAAEGPLSSAPGPLPTSLYPLVHHALYLQAQAVDFLQIREKCLPAPDLLALLQALRVILPPDFKPRLLLNLGHDHLPPQSLLDLAVQARLDGLHLPSTAPAHLAEAARTRFAHANLPPPFLSASVHTPLEIDRIHPAHPDLLLFGPVFGKIVRNTPVHPPLGLPALAQAVRHAAPTPVLALGGLTPDNTAAALAIGAVGIASIRLFLPT